MPTCTDQMGRAVKAPDHPQRIISLVPSQTELLFDLGLGDRVVGITKFCIHPQEWYRTKLRVGGTKRVDLEKVRAIKPDLIIGNKEENAIGDIAALEREFPVWMSEVEDLDGALKMIGRIGQITGTAARAEEIKTGIRSAFEGLEPLSPPLSAAYFIWKDPWMVAGKGTFIADLLQRCGFTLPAGIGGRYPELSPEALQTLGPDVVLLSSEPYPFSEKHIGEAAELFPGIPILLVDGEMFSWYGSRLLRSTGYFRELMARVRG